MVLHYKELRAALASDIPVAASDKCADLSLPLAQVCVPVLATGSKNSFGFKKEIPTKNLEIDVKWWAGKGKKGEVALGLCYTVFPNGYQQHPVSSCNIVCT